MSLFYKRNKYIKKSKGKVGDIMTSLKTANRRVGSLFAVAALVLATITPGLVPAFASAAQIAERSVTLSTFTKGATQVEYTVNFTSVSAAGAVVVDFCKNSPLVESECTAPVGFSVASATTDTDGFTLSQTTASGDNAVVLTGTVDATEEVELAIGGVTNATELGTVYARIVTYNNEASALAYESNDIGAGNIDHGSAAFSINDTVNVSGAVLETMTFCVSGALPITGNCAGPELTDPVLALGEGTGDFKALSTAQTSTGSIYSQLSTNAAGGAVVSLKSNRVGCGGLVRAGATNCDILPATGSTGILPGEAKFGVQVASATDPDINAAPNGILRAASNSAYYNDSVFKLNFVEEEDAGVTGPYGDPFFDTAGAPVSDKNVQITFGARVNNQTPAGTYSADLSLIATGKF